MPDKAITPEELNLLIEQTYKVEKDFSELKASYDYLQDTVEKVVEFLPNAVWVLNSFHINVVDDVRTAHVSRCSFENLHPDRRVRPGVPDHPRTERREVAVCVASRPYLDLDRVSLGVDAERLLPRERAGDRPSEQVRGERRLALVRHVFLAPEGAPIGD